jgi:hypothetical protein
MGQLLLEGSCFLAKDFHTMPKERNTLWIFWSKALVILMLVIILTAVFARKAVNRYKIKHDIEM